MLRLPDVEGALSPSGVRSTKVRPMTPRSILLRPAETAMPKAVPAALGGGRLSLVVVFYFLMIALPIHFNVGPIFMTGIRAILLVTTVPLTIRLFSGQLGRVLPTDVLLLIYVCWSVMMLFVHSPSQAVTIGGAYFLEVFGSYILARTFIRTPEQFRSLCYGLLSILIFSLPFAIYETQTGRPVVPLIIESIPGLSSHPDYSSTTFGSRLGLERSQVIFGHPIHYGLFCSSLISLILVGLKGSIGNAVRYLFGFLISLGVIASVSSGAVLPMFLQFFLMVWAAIFRNMPSRWIALSVIVIVCYIAVDLISNRTAIEVFLSRTALSAETAYGRIVIFRWGMVNVWSNPIFGIGLNDWVRPFWLAGSMDNFWLLLTVRYGIPGFFLMAMAYLSLIWKVVQSKLGVAGQVWQFRRAWVFMQIAMVLTLCTVDVWETPLSYVFFMLGAGAWLTVAQPAGEKTAAIVVPAREHIGNRYSRFSQVKGRRDQS